MLDALDALDGAAAGSPYLQAKGKAIIESSYAPQFSVDGARKDTGLLGAFDAASEAGHGYDDMAAVYFGFHRGWFGFVTARSIT